MAWQGGGRQVARLVPEGGGRYRSASPVETGAGWKTMVFVARGARMGAFAVSFPSDLEYGTPGTPLEPVRSGPLEAAPALLMSETHGGPTWVATVAYAALWIVSAAWIALLVNAYRLAGTGRPGPLTEDRVAAPAA